MSHEKNELNTKQEKNISVMQNNQISMVDRLEIEKAQKKWAEGIIQIGKAFTKQLDYKKVASDFVDEVYAYHLHHNGVLFKPTKAVKNRFRSTRDGAISYFVGGDAALKEDHGFALAPWTSIVFENKVFYVNKTILVVMGSYYFSSASQNNVEVDYTFGYTREGRDLKIVLHHSSLPYQP